MTDEGERVDVVTPSGPVRGRRSSSGFVFAGIPFAEPPLGPLRLAPPRAARPWSGTRAADAFPPPPAQPGGVAESSEDCLSLNVWTPSLRGALPVVVWVYGGGFEGGSASPPLTDGASLAHSLGAVVVAPNYRVGALGFLHTELGANLGTQDVMAALEWVRSSAPAFGGDARAVTVMGQSAGAFVIGTMLGVPRARGLFERAILQSGSTTRIYARETAEAIRAALFATLGVTSVHELQQLPVDDIIEAQSSAIDQDIGRRNLPGGRAWGTVLDGTWLTEDPHAAVERGAASDIPLLISATRDEVQFFEVLQGAAFVPQDESVLLDEMARGGVAQPEQLLGAYRVAAPEATLSRLRSRFLSDCIYRWPAQRLAAAQAAAGGTAYLAEFTAAPFGPGFGACHGIDLSYQFGQLGQGGLVAPDTPENRAIKEEIVASWRAFVHTGEADWPAVVAGAAMPGLRQFGPPSPPGTPAPKRS